MKTTLHIDEKVMKLLKARASQEGRTMSELIEASIRLLLAKKRGTTRRLPAMPRVDGGGTSVNVANRDDLYRAMED